MGGWKRVKGLTLCHQNCCYGYQERPMPVPLLQDLVVCQKLTPEEIEEQQTAALKAIALRSSSKPLKPTEPPRELPKAALRYLRDISEVANDLIDNGPADLGDGDSFVGGRNGRDAHTSVRH